MGRGRYGLQTIIFWALKYATKIAVKPPQETAIGDQSFPFNGHDARRIVPFPRQTQWQKNFWIVRSAPSCSLRPNPRFVPSEPSTFPKSKPRPLSLRTSSILPSIMVRRAGHHAKSQVGIPACRNTRLMFSGAGGRRPRSTWRTVSTTASDTGVGTPHSRPRATT